MFKEDLKANAFDSESVLLNLRSNEGAGVQMTGHHIDRIFKNGELIDVREGHNLVVNSCLKLIMCLLKHQSGYSGVQYWAVGSGASSWDSAIPAPDIDAVKLTAELGRVAIPASEIKFLNGSYAEVSSPTNIIQIKHLFGEGDCNGVWREFGIFGGNATGASNSGILINKRHHEILTKTSEMTVERTMRFTLNLV